MEVHQLRVAFRGERTADLGKVRKADRVAVRADNRSIVRAIFVVGRRGDDRKALAGGKRARGDFGHVCGVPGIRRGAAGLRLGGIEPRPVVAVPHIVHAEHDEDAIGLLCQHVMVPPLDAAIGRAAADAAVHDARPAARKAQVPEQLEIRAILSAMRDGIAQQRHPFAIRKGRRRP